MLPVDDVMGSTARCAEFQSQPGVGLGDIVPVLPMARAHHDEEVSGVMYLALVVSRLIALAVMTRGAR